MWNFKGNLWNSTQNILLIHWKMMILYNVENVRALRFKSSEVFLTPLYQQRWIDSSHNSHNALDKYPTMHHFVTEMCTCVHISVTKWSIVGHGTVALWDLWDWSNKPALVQHTHEIKGATYILFPTFSGCVHFRYCDSTSRRGGLPGDWGAGPASMDDPGGCHVSILGRK